MAVPPPFLVVTNLPHGNVCDVQVMPDEDRPIVRFAADPKSGAEALWFCFRIKRVPRTRLVTELRLVLTNAPTLLGAGSYDDEDQARLRPVARYPGGDWKRLPPGEARRHPDGRVDVEWTITAPTESCDVAFCYPYGEAELKETLEATNGAWRADTIGASQGGRPLVRLSNGPGKPGDDRPGVYVLARQHAGETPGSWVLDGLLRESARRKGKGPLIWTVPIADPDGVEEGAYGKDRFPHDLNRAWDVPAMRHEVLVIQQDLESWRKRCRPVLGLDLHAPGACEGPGIYAFAPRWEHHAQRDRVLPWAEKFRTSLKELAAEEFAHVANYPSRWTAGANFETYCWRHLGVPGLVIEIPYALARKTVLTREAYREAGARLAEAIVAGTV